MTKKKKILLIAFGMAIFVTFFHFPAVAKKAFREHQWLFYREVTFNPSEPVKPQGFPLPFEMMRQGGPHFRNYRLIDAQKRMVPYGVWKKDRWVKPSRKVQLKIIDVQMEGEKKEIILENPKRKELHKIHCDIQKGDFQIWATVYGADNLENWEVVKDRTLLLDFSSQIPFRKDTISFPTRNDRYFKLVLTRVVPDEMRGEGPFSLELDYGKIRLRHSGNEMSKLSFQRFTGFTEEKKKKEVINQHTFENFDMTTDAHGLTTILIKNIYIPFIAITIDTPKKNFFREVTITRLSNFIEENSRKVPLKKDSLYNFSIEGMEQSRNRIENLSQGNSFLYPHLQIEINHRDSPAIPISKITLEWIEHAFLFYPLNTSTNLGYPNRYFVYYGSDSIDPVQYDVLQVWKRSGKKQYQTAHLGPEVKNMKYRKTAGTFLQDHPMILNGVIIILALTMFIWLWLLFRNSSSNPGSPDSRR